LPSPDSPQTNSGLYALAGASDTATAAACANRFDAPMTKVSNVYFSLSLVCELDARPDAAGAAAAGPTAPVAPVAVGQTWFTVASAVSSPGRPGPLIGPAAGPVTGAPPRAMSSGTAGDGSVNCDGNCGGTGSGWSTLTASETCRPEGRDRASLIGSRSARSMASLAKSLGAASSAVPSSRPIGRVTRIQARCCGESVPLERSRTTSFHTWPRSVCRSD